ncbi:MAG TPA: hypothetical protein VE197_00225 [Mycobacterium sp.]|nr:hypothetical protein [Mycobacterium sp.]
MSAVVTGSGIGRAVAARLRDAGHDVVVWDQAGGDIDCDVSNPEAVTGQVVHADGGLALHSPIDAYGEVQRLAAQQQKRRQKL